MAKEKVIDIKKKYPTEVNEIQYILKYLRDGRYYEKTQAPQDGYLTTHLDKLEKYLSDLFYKIEYDEPSVIEMFSKYADKI